MRTSEAAFRNRTEELAGLEETYARPGGRMVLMFGRRRVGKTRLLRRFSENKPSLAYVATTESETAQLERFSERVAEYFGDRPPEKFTSWAQALERLLRRTAGEPGRHLVVMDEFQNIVSQNPAVPSILQALWDEVGESSETMVVLCGSIISELERIAAGSQPLYGRFSGIYRIRPFSFDEASLFFPGADIAKRVGFYAVLGGMPMYLNLGASYSNIWRLIESELLEPRSILYEELPLLLSQELREPANYVTILALVSRGLTRQSQIAAEMNMKATTLVHYLSRLVEMELLERVVPVTESSPEKSKKGTYAIKDNFVRFWFRFVFPHKQMVEDGDREAVLGIVRRNFDTHLGWVAGDVARQAVRRANRNGELPARFMRIGRYWDRKNEIDICGVPDGENPYLWGECRWSARKMDAGDLRALEEKVRATGLGREREDLYLLCSRSGFTKGLLAEDKQRDNLLLWGTDELAGKHST